MAESLDEVISDAASSPHVISVDGQIVRERLLGEVIEADRYLRSKESAGSKTGGLRFTKLLPPGAR